MSRPVTDTPVTNEPRYYIDMVDVNGHQTIHHVTTDINAHQRHMDLLIEHGFGNHIIERRVKSGS